MSAFSGTIQLGLFAFIGFALFTALASGLLYPALRKRLLKSAPAVRARVLSLWAAAPLLFGGVLTVLCFLPSLLGDDHCNVHNDVHAHFCVIHPMSSLGFFGGWYLLSFFALLALSFFLWKLASLWRFSLSLAALRKLSRYDAQRGVFVVDSSFYLALSGGVTRSSVYLSSKLLEVLPGELLDAVVAHENAHLLRYDALRKLLASWLSFLHLPLIRRQLLADLSLACEQACDEEASHKLEDRLQVAEAIIAVERLLQNQTPNDPVFCSFIGGDVDARVEALLHDPIRQNNTSRFWYIACVAALFALAEPLHHFAENFWHLLLG